MCLGCSVVLRKMPACFRLKSVVQIRVPILILHNVRNLFRIIGPVICILRALSVR
jgi:hypothetical protein